MDLDPAAVEAAGRAICHDGWDVAAERAVHIGSVRAALAAAAPFIARATADAIADRIVKLAPYNCELRPDGSEDPTMTAWVQGIKDASDAARSFTTAVVTE